MTLNYTDVLSGHLIDLARFAPLVSSVPEVAALFSSLPFPFSPALGRDVSSVVRSFFISSFVVLSLIAILSASLPFSGLDFFLGNVIPQNGKLMRRPIP